MTAPEINHTRVMGGTTDSNRIVVKVERAAALNEDLTEVIGRTDGRIQLVTHNDLPAAKAFGISLLEARRLMEALGAAIDDVIAAEKANALIEKRTS